MEIANLSFQYGQKPILKEIHLSFTKGKIYGLIGENGAGKTTLISLLAGSLKAHSGEIKGIHQPGLLLQGIGFYDEATPIENLKIHQQITRNHSLDISYLLDLLDFSQEYRQKKVKELSQGYKQRLQIARSFMTEGPLILLDEPFTAVDPTTIKSIKKSIRLMAQESQKTLIISSHQLREIEDLIESAIFLKNGKVREVPLEAQSGNRFLIQGIQKIEESVLQLLDPICEYQLSGRQMNLQLKVKRSIWEVMKILEENHIIWEAVQTGNSMTALYIENIEQA